MSTPYELGQFVWHDLMTNDRESAIAFFTNLFGWTTQDQDMGPEAGIYTMINSGDDGLGGIISMDPSYDLPSHWTTYIAVADVDEACRRAVELGGEVPVQPFDIPEVGRTAVIKDVTGAHFSPFKDIKESYDIPGRRPGLVAWHELVSTDIEKSNAFYTSLINWNLGEMDMGDNGTYYLYRIDDRDTAGAVQMNDEMEAPSYWLPYIGVSDVPAMAEKAKELGGQLLDGPQQTGEPANVHFAVLASPDGSTFGILEV